MLSSETMACTKWSGKRSKCCMIYITRTEKYIVQITNVGVDERAGAHCCEWREEPGSRKVGERQAGDSAKTFGKESKASYPEASGVRKERGCLRRLLDSWPAFSSKYPQTREEQMCPCGVLFQYTATHINENVTL